MPARSRRRAAAAPVLGDNHYGKSRVRLMKVVRDTRTGRHTVHELSVDIALEGDFEHVHTRGDNRLCLPTDTMKNTVYALGKGHALEPIEGFARDLCAHFLSRHRPVQAARVRIERTPWDRAEINGRGEPHCFIQGQSERQTCTVTARRGAPPRVEAGIDHLVILKSKGSAFSGYPKDRWTTLPETRDRLFATALAARWLYRPNADPRRGWASSRAGVRRALLRTFAAHKSESVQHTLYAMGAAALRAVAAVERIHLSMPNKHCLLVDLRPLGLTNPNEVFVPTDEPHGLIEATIQRA